MSQTAERFHKTPDQVKATQLLGSLARFVMLYGGSRSGKTFILVRTIVLRALKAPGSRHVMLRFAFNHIKTSIWYDTFPKVMKIAFPGANYYTNKSDWFISFDNGSEIWIGGLDDKERTEKILGNEYATMYFNEVSQISYSSVELALTRLAQKTSLFNKAYFDCNPPGKGHWSYKIFEQHLHPFTNDKVRGELYASMMMNPDGNRQNLTDDYIETFLDTLSEAKRRRFKLGEWLDDNLNTLWKESHIHNHRVTILPPLKRIVVAVDPAVSSNSESDETGIICAGLGYNGHAYVFADYSGTYSPSAWAKKVSYAFHTHKADIVVVEVNQGGDLVVSNLQTEDKALPVKRIHAKRGKALRAEPVVAFYEQGKVHHVGVLAALESQMTSWNPAESDSPDRVDALVYAVTELMFNNNVISQPSTAF